MDAKVCSDFSHVPTYIERKAAWVKWTEHATFMSESSTFSSSTISVQRDGVSWIWSIHLLETRVSDKRRSTDRCRKSLSKAFSVMDCLMISIHISRGKVSNVIRYLAALTHQMMKRCYNHCLVRALWISFIHLLETRVSGKRRSTNKSRSYSVMDIWMTSSHISLGKVSNVIRCEGWFIFMRSIRELVVSKLFVEIELAADHFRPPVFDALLMRWGLVTFLYQCANILTLLSIKLGAPSCRRCASEHVNRPLSRSKQTFRPS